jgi:carbamate kinase
MRVVVALGGNALAARGERIDAATQRRHLREAAGELCAIAERHQTVITHGNGPQVGLLALQAEAYDPERPVPLDVLGAESEGMIGYLVEQELRGRLPGREFATLLTQVVVDPDDPAFRKPSKPIGPRLDPARAERQRRERGHRVAPDGDALRRVVPSPEPRRILELTAIRMLLEAGLVVVCAGGGGIPVVIDASGAIRGVEAVIDKDLAAALLACELDADALLLLTDVDAVYADWPAATRPIRSATPAALRGLSFAAGSMAPKVEAACRFAASGPRVAAIGRLAQAALILEGEAGTQVRSR